MGFCIKKPVLYSRVPLVGSIGYAPPGFNNGGELVSTGIEAEGKQAMR